MKIILGIETVDPSHSKAELCPQKNIKNLRLEICLFLPPRFLFSKTQCLYGIG